MKKHTCASLNGYWVYIHKKATNVFRWQETGQLPLMFKALELARKYADRLQRLDKGRFAYQAAVVQKTLSLKWFRMMEEGTTNTSKILELKNQFINLARIYNNCHSKMEVVLQTGSVFGMQLYLQVIPDFSVRQSITKLRGSCHWKSRLGDIARSPERRGYVYPARIVALLYTVEDEAHLGKCVLTSAIRAEHHLAEGSNCLMELAMSRSAVDHNRIGPAIKAMYAAKISAMKALAKAKANDQQTN